MLRKRRVHTILILFVILTNGFYLNLMYPEISSTILATEIRRPSPKVEVLGDPKTVRLHSTSKGEASIVRNFELKGKVNRSVVNFEVTEPGQIKVQSNWKGTTQKLTLILNGPGQRQAYARKDGRSPLNLSYDITKKMVSVGKDWRVSVVNFSSKGNAAGTIRIAHTKAAKQTIRPRASATSKRVITPKPIEKPKPVIKPKESETSKPIIRLKVQEKLKPEFTLQQINATVKNRLETRIRTVTHNHPLAKIVVPLFMQHIEEKSQKPLIVNGIDVSPDLQTMVNGYKQISPFVKRRSFHPRYMQLRPYQTINKLQLGRDVLEALRPNYKREIRQMVRKSFSADRPKFHWDSSKIRESSAGTVRARLTAEQKRKKLTANQLRQIDSTVAKLRINRSVEAQRQLKKFLRDNNFVMDKVSLKPLPGSQYFAPPDLNNDHVIRDYYRYSVVPDWFKCFQENEYYEDEPYWHISASIPCYDPKDPENMHRLKEGNLYRLYSRVTGDYENIDAGDTRIFRSQDRYLITNNIFNTPTNFTIGLWEHDLSKGMTREAIDNAMRDLAEDIKDQIYEAIITAFEDAFYLALEEILPDELRTALQIFLNGEIGFSELMTIVEDVMGGVDFSWLVIEIIFSGKSITEIILDIGGACPEFTIILVAIEVVGPVLVDLFEGDFEEAFEGLIFLPVEVIKYFVDLVINFIDTIEMLIRYCDMDDFIDQVSVKIEGSYDDIWQDSDWDASGDRRGEENPFNGSYMSFPIRTAQDFYDEHGYGPTEQTCSLIKSNFYHQPAYEFKGDDAEYYAYCNVKRTLWGGIETFGYTIKDGSESYMETRSYRSKYPGTRKIKVSICALNTEQVPFVILSGRGGSGCNINGEREFYVDTTGIYDYELSIFWYGEGDIYGYVTVKDLPSETDEEDQDIPPDEREDGREWK